MDSHYWQGHFSTNPTILQAGRAINERIRCCEQSVESLFFGNDGGNWLPHLEKSMFPSSQRVDVHQLNSLTHRNAMLSHQGETTPSSR